MQLTRALKGIHEQGYLHLDVKPDNVLTSFLKKDNGIMEPIDGLLHKVYLIDYGLAEKFLDDDGNHRPQRDNMRNQGHPFFVSYDALCDRTQSRRDDLLSMMYTLVYMANS